MCGHITTGLCALLFLIALGLALAMLMRPLYVWEIDRLGIAVASGLSKEEILINYDGLIRWCMPWNKAPFYLETLPWTGDAAVHFDKVKHLFRIIYAAGALGGAGALFLLRPIAANPGNRLRIAGAVVLAVPAVIAAWGLSNFNRAFVIFHEVLFPGDYWLFDYRVDPVILLLPERLFLHRFVLIAATVIAGGLVLALLGRKRNL